MENEGVAAQLEKLIIKIKNKRRLQRKKLQKVKVKSRGKKARKKKTKKAKVKSKGKKSKRKKVKR